MSTPALIYLVLAGISLGFSLANHGQPKTGNHSFWWSLFSVAIGLSLLHAGGFFVAVKP